MKVKKLSLSPHQIWFNGPQKDPVCLQTHADSTSPFPFGFSAGPAPSHKSVCMSGRLSESDDGKKQPELVAEGLSLLPIPLLLGQQTNAMRYFKRSNHPQPNALMTEQSNHIMSREAESRNQKPIFIGPRRLSVDKFVRISIGGTVALTESPKLTRPIRVLSRKYLRGIQTRWKQLPLS